MNSISYLIDIIYPPRCHICGGFLPADSDQRPSYHLCDNCLDGLVPITHPLCTICGLPFHTSKGQDHICENCLRKRPWYTIARAPYLYSGPLMESIVSLKYNAETHLIPSLGALLSCFAKELISEPKDFLTIPVPLHRTRLRQRGFNQSLLLAKVLCSNLGTKLNYLSLVRDRDTRSQTGLAREARRKNVKDAFSVINPEAIEGEDILLVDDVYTTGHTLNECARTLKKSGAAAVICLTLARTLLD